jgi:hypothetical protein
VAHAQLKELYSRLGHLRATRDSETDPGRRSVYEAEAKDIANRINKLKADPNYNTSDR